MYFSSSWTIDERTLLDVFQLKLND